MQLEANQLVLSSTRQARFALQGMKAKLPSSEEEERYNRILCLGFFFLTKNTLQTSWNKQDKILGSLDQLDNMFNEVLK